MTYPLGDMLVRLKNAYLSRHQEVRVPYSHLKEVVVKLLKEEKFIKDYLVEGEGVKKEILITLAYKKEKGSFKPALHNLKLVSKPGRRIYVSVDEIPSVFSGLGINILSTSKGILTGAQAKAKNVGGELICQIW